METPGNSQIKAILREASEVLLNKEREILLALVGVLSRGHLLIEDVPGMGKTTLVRLLGQLLGMKVNRIQFTNDMLPSDIIGTSIYDKKTGEFLFKKGPIFGQLILADELNRATPKTQSALLQSMEEGQVSVDGREYSLDDNFLIMATQNPFQQIGTYRLPESQIDRFFMGLFLGPPVRNEEKKIIRGMDKSVGDLGAVIEEGELREWRKLIGQVELSESLLDYIVDLLERGRQEFDEGVLISPRSGRDLGLAAKAHAFVDDRNYVIPEDVQAVAPGVLGHRIGASRGVRYGHSQIAELLEAVAIP